MTRIGIKKIKRINGALFLIALALGILILSRGRTPQPVDQALPVPLRATFMMPDSYAYRQDDARWAEDTIGATSDTLYAYGCTIASVAMAASNLTGQTMSPQILNANLSENGGFTDRGWLIWDKVNAATQGAVTATYFDKPSHSTINQCMTQGGYPVVKIKLHESIVHWVAIVGKADDEYLIRDPLVGVQTDPPIGLSTRANKIHAVRCVTKAP